jgi:hypothetical protein
MSEDISFRTDSASLEQVTALLRHTDASFVPPLSSRVDLAAYAHKIVSHAVRLEAWHGAEPVALLAMQRSGQRDRLYYQRQCGARLCQARHRQCVAGRRHGACPRGGHARHRARGRCQQQRRTAPL